MKALCLTLVALVAIASSSAAQSLADAAKQEEARRKAIKTPSKVYTDADLKRVAPGSPQAATPAATQPATAGTPAAPEAAAREGQPKADEAGGQQEAEKDEAWWRSRIMEARSKLERAKLQHDAMQTRINSLTNDWTARDDPVQRQQLAQERARAIGELGRLKQDIDAQTKAIADIEEEARRAGVPPGWLR